MSSNVATLRKGFIAKVALERLGAVMPSEVIPQIARLFEYLIASWDYALKVLFIPERLRIIDFDYPVPFLWNSFKELFRPLFALQLDLFFDQLGDIRVLICDFIEVLLLNFLFC